MNPKLREFERASSLEIYGLGRDRVKWESAMEKFAELIVKECANAFWTEDCNVSDLALEEYNRNSKKIKQHFEIDK